MRRIIPLELGPDVAPISGVPNWRVIHGVVFVLAMAGTLLVPVLRRWPWVWLAPFVAYFGIVAIVPRLRSSLCWLRVGRVSAASVGVTMGIMALSTLVLVGFQATVHPDLHGVRAAWPFESLGGVITAGVIFVIINATLGELLFRGVLFEALQSQWGNWFTVIATGLFFGLGHLKGYPSGPLGACLAALFGFALGTLRVWTGGLVLPIVAHMGADATIYGILVYSGLV